LEGVKLLAADAKTWPPGRSGGHVRCRHHTLSNPAKDFLRHHAQSPGDFRHGPRLFGRLDLWCGRPLGVQGALHHVGQGQGGGGGRVLPGFVQVLAEDGVNSGIHGSEGGVGLIKGVGK
jgi:hypothetical protein